MDSTYEYYKDKFNHIKGCMLTTSNNELLDMYVEFKNDHKDFENREDFINWSPETEALLYDIVQYIRNAILYRMNN